MSDEIIVKPRGTTDILPDEVHRWTNAESTFRRNCEAFGFEEIRTPYFEYTKLFDRGVGETTDIVQKEMFSVVPSVKMRSIYEPDFDPEAFKRSQAKEGLTLKPEGTAPVMRAYVENKLYAQGGITKLFYITPCFRHERPQAGRLRAFHQMGVEALGTTSPTVDAEVITVAATYLESMGIPKTTLKINSIGCPTCRPTYHAALKAYLEPKLPKLCDLCNERFHKNPLRVLDCKNDSCRAEVADAPKMLDYLCEECSTHFDGVKRMLDAMGTAYEVDPGIVRGLDYYTKTAFEFVSESLGAQSTVCGGGRYDGLVEQIGGPSTPGVGFGMGMERLLLAIENAGTLQEKAQMMQLYIMVRGEDNLPAAGKLITAMRRLGIRSEMEHDGRSIKAQFKYANKRGIPYVIVIGDEERESGNIVVKRMEDGTESAFSLDDSIGISDFILK
ncbi:MAG: histidyl-tRNA synthetase [Clostridiales bacterium]|jgi:histidyl-tRNA synthetase|nr:histidyl-tRNA synthetase [Clostridiales bacterium]